MLAYSCLCFKEARGWWKNGEIILKPATRSKYLRNDARGFFKDH